MSSKTNKVYTIDVTARDIAKGVKNDIDQCSVARAARRVFRRSLNVDGFTINIGDGFLSEYRELSLPKRARNWIHKFDSGKTVKPFSFKVRG